MSVPIRDVLVVHPNAGRRAALASALPSYRVVAVESKKEAAFRMADAAPALIIAPPDEARLFLAEVAHAAPDALRVFICSKSDPAGLAELMQSAAEGHVFSVLDEALSGPELGRTISHLLQHRGSAFATVPPALYSVGFECDEQSYPARCVEIGNFGATLLLPEDVPAAGFPPGATLESLRIEREGQLLFKTTWAHVQRAQPSADEHGTHLRLGISWATAMHPPPPVPGVTMEEQSEVVATLRKGLRREAVLWMQRANDSSVQLRLEEPVVEMVDGVAVLRCRAAGMLECSVGDEVDLFFEMGGQSYSGVGQLLAHDVGREGGGAGAACARHPQLAQPAALQARVRQPFPRLLPVPHHRPAHHPDPAGPERRRAVLPLRRLERNHPRGLPARRHAAAAGRLLHPVPARGALHPRLPSDGRPDGGLRPFRAGARFSGLAQAPGTPSCGAFMRSRCAAISDGSPRPLPGHLAPDGGGPLPLPPGLPLRGGLAAGHAGGHPPQGRTPRGTWAGRLVYSEGQGHAGTSPACASTRARGWSSTWPCARPSAARSSISRDLAASSSTRRGPAGHRVHPLLLAQGQRWPDRLTGWLARAMETPGLSSCGTSTTCACRLLPAACRPPRGCRRCAPAHADSRAGLSPPARPGELVRLLADICSPTRR